MGTIAVSNSLIPIIKDTPLDARSRILVLDELSNVENPYEGMDIYVKALKRSVQVTKLAKVGFTNKIEEVSYRVNKNNLREDLADDIATKSDIDNLF